MKITRYFPGFARDGDEPDIISEFDTLEQLMQIPWVKGWPEPLQAEPVAYGYSMSGRHLMADFHNPRKWWVVGIMHETYNLGLPEFKAK